VTVAEYQRKPLKVTAEQFYSKGTWPAGVVFDDAGFFVLLSEGPPKRSFLVQDKDWIVTYEDGTRRVMNPDEFEREFEAV
jgi:hypothetical protein